MNKIKNLSQRIFVKTVSVPSLLKWLDERLTTADDNYRACKKAGNDLEAAMWNGHAYEIIEIRDRLRNYYYPSPEVEEGGRP